MHIQDSPWVFSSGCAVSSVVEHYLDTAPLAQRNALQIDDISRNSTARTNILSNKVSNTSRFRRVDRCIQRLVRTGELWFVGRRGSKVVWQRLRTQNLRVARATVAMIESQINGNHEIFLVEDGKLRPLETTVPPSAPHRPLPRLRQVTAPVDSDLSATAAVLRGFTFLDH